MNQVNALLLTHSHFCPDQTELALLAKTYPQIQATIVEGAHYSARQLAQAQIIVGFPKPDDLPNAVNLRWLQTPSSGVAQYMDRSLFVRNDFVLTNARGTYGRQIADHVMGLVIAFNHNLLTYHDQMKQKLWKRYFPLKDIWESTLLVIGLGDLGHHIAKRAKEYGMKVLCVKRTLSEKPAYIDILETIDHLDELLEQADYVVLAAASTTDTENMLNKERLMQMKPGSYVINVARGSMIEHQALVEVLANGHLGGAALDVTDPEPLPPDSPLWTFPNVLITPHASGLSHSDPHQVFTLFLENLGHFFGDGILRNQVDFERKY
ncbi:D-2-hydroxyacid dehydrogenase [Sphaerochaeta sp.]|uniref:D-2-hydroxyacid dehydrogenase n=1 Tax=Sphaerochaeta sp. TaxID=1972642 RepID=UPI002FCA37B5